MDQSQRSSKKQRVQLRVRTSSGSTLRAVARRVKMPVGQRLRLELDLDDPVIGSTSSSSSSTEPVPEEVQDEDDEVTRKVLEKDAGVLEHASQEDPSILDLPRERGAATHEEMLRSTLSHRVGMAWFTLWRMGVLQDDMVVERYGEIVLDMFRVRWPALMQMELKGTPRHRCPVLDLETVVAGKLMRAVALLLAPPRYLASLTLLWMWCKWRMASWPLRLWWECPMRLAWLLQPRKALAP